jgi:hypothetical protein
MSPWSAAPGETKAAGVAPGRDVRTDHITMPGTGDAAKLHVFRSRSPDAQIPSGGGGRISPSAAGQKGFDGRRASVFVSGIYAEAGELTFRLRAGAARPIFDRAHPDCILHRAPCGAPMCLSRMGLLLSCPGPSPGAGATTSHAGNAESFHRLPPFCFDLIVRLLARPAPDAGRA